MDHFDTSLSVFETDQQFGIQTLHSLVDDTRKYFRERGVDLGSQLDEPAVEGNSWSSDRVAKLPAYVSSAPRDTQLLRLQNVLNEYREYLNREIDRGAI
jgi:hypothetical protein